MSDYQSGILALSVLTIIFNAGGFIWLAKNHMAHVQKALDEVSVRLGALERAVSHIQGTLEK